MHAVEAVGAGCRPDREVVKPVTIGQVIERGQLAGHALARIGVFDLERRLAVPSGPTHGVAIGVEYLVHRWCGVSEGGVGHAGGKRTGAQDCQGNSHGSSEWVGREVCGRI
jgi:hypothetical protein